ncbi:endolytic transglycosylase MltG [Streptomyces sp. NPDC051940]|uniref:endolytic transglycosylase MltG n=1 Tax=Streptomyces sp. NPDC051940 TaxID=3155675 RepID=UPI003417BE17
MTEYGRGPGSEPWYQGDPLSGNTGQHGTYGAQASYGGGQQPYPQQGGGQGGWHTGQQPQYPGGGHTGQQPAYGGGGWDTTGGMPAVDPYGQPQQPGGPAPDYYGTPEAYPPPGPPRRGPGGPRRERPGNWDEGLPPERDHAFFSDDDEQEIVPGRGERPSRRGGGRGGRRDRDLERREGTKKRKNGCACLVVALVLLGGGGAVAYYGYDYVKSNFLADAPDYEGDGITETVTFEIPQGASIGQMGNILKEKGVVKSVDAFTSAAAENDKSGNIQAGTYTLKKQMSAKSAIEALLDPAIRNALTIPEGTPNYKIYALIDDKLGLKDGDTKAAAKEHYKDLGLPDWAKSGGDIKDPLEGFLFPAQYNAGKGTKPEALLKQMVSRAKEEFTKAGVADNAAKLGLKDPWQVLTVASLVQAEGNNQADFEKITRVVLNRMKPDNPETIGRLDFDSTYNYIKKQSTLDLPPASEMRNLKDPYNTYYVQGLPAGPIGNPGAMAIEATHNPAKGPWNYFVSLKEKTLFAVTNDEHQKNVEIYNKEREAEG